MNILVPIFWAIVIVVWIVSALTKKQASSPPPGEAPMGEEGYRKPEEALERFLRRMTGEEEIKATPPFEPIVEREVSPSPPEVAIVAPPQPEEPFYEVKVPERKEKIRSCLPGLLDRSTVRRGIILSEILGPPRAEKPL